MRYVELVRRGCVVAGDLNDQEIQEYVSNGYLMRWQQSLRDRGKSKKTVKNKHGIAAT